MHNFLPCIHFLPLHLHVHKRLLQNQGCVMCQGRRSMPGAGGLVWQMLLCLSYACGEFSLCLRCVCKYMYKSTQKQLTGAKSFDPRMNPMTAHMELVCCWCIISHMPTPCKIFAVVCLDHSTTEVHMILGVPSFVFSNSMRKVPV
jgi:hypothetical protein